MQGKRNQKKGKTIPTRKKNANARITFFINFINILKLIQRSIGNGIVNQRTSTD